MFNNIIASIRPCSQLHGNTFFIALELAHRLNPQGWGRVSYRFLAWKAHCCERTAQRQVARLVQEHHLFRKYTSRTPHGNAINLYQYIGPRLHTAFPPATTHGDTLLPTLPPPGREKETSLRQDIENLKRGLRLFGTPGTHHWASSSARLAELEALQAAYHTLKGTYDA